MNLSKVFLLIGISTLSISCSQQESSDNTTDIGINQREIASESPSAGNANTSNNSSSTNNNNTANNSSGSGSGQTQAPTAERLDFNRPFTIVNDSYGNLEGNYANISEFATAARDIDACIYAIRQGDTPGSNSLYPSRTYMHLGFGPCLYITFTQN